MLLEPAELVRAVSLLRRDPVDSSLPPLTNLQFVVDVNGRIDPSRLWTTFWAESLSVNRAQPEFLAIRFQPGIHRGVPVRTEVGVPVRWVDGRASPAAELATWNPGVDSLPDVAAMADSIREGRGGEEREVVDVEDVEVLPRLLNAGEIQAAMVSLYPDRLRDDGVTGKVDVRFVIDARGRVDLGSISVVRIAHEGFREATVVLTGRMRFSPARIDGKPVPVLVQMPIGWVLMP